jgi:enoyl-CoA hydratase
VIDADRPRPDVLRLRLNRPERRNALDRAMVERLIDSFAEDGDDTSAVVVTANGSFCSGLDLSMADYEREQVSDRLYDLYSLMIRFPRPILAAARGHAMGAGAQLLVACDLRVVAPGCEIRFPGPAHGLAVGSWALPGLIGRGRAMDLCLTMRSVGHEEALRIGLVDRVADEPEETALALAFEFAELNGGAVERVKAVTLEASGQARALESEADGNRGHVPSADQTGAPGRGEGRSRWS